MNEMQLRRFVRKVIRERLSRKHKKLSLAEMLFEQEAQAEKSGDFKAVTTMTNIKDLDTADAYSQLASGDEEAPLIQAMMTATGWASGAISSAGGAPAIKKWAEDTGEGELTARISHIAGELPGGAPAKQDMPALEGGDAIAVADALSPGGDFTIDLETDFADGKEDFDTWYEALSDEEKAAFEAGEIPGQNEEAEAKKEGVASLTATLFEDKYPRDGMGPLGGAPNKGESGFRKRMRRRLVATVDVAEGQVLTAEVVGLMRPLEPKGLSPEFYDSVVGKKAARAIRQHEPIDWDAITGTTDA